MTTFPFSSLCRTFSFHESTIGIFEVALLFPFSNLIVKLTYLIIPGKDEKEDDKKLQYIGEHLVYTLTAAVPKAIKEIERMGHIAVSNLEKSMEALLTNNVDLAKEVYDVEQNINYLNKEITEYLVKVNQLSIPIGDKETLANLFHIVNDIERIGDHAENMADYAIEITNSNISISKQGKEEIKEMLNLTKTILNNSLDTFTNKNKDSLDEILSLENKLDNKERELQKNHVLRLTNNQCTPQASTVFADVISNLERVADHGTNITLSMLDYNTKFVVVD